MSTIQPDSGTPERPDSAQPAARMVVDLAALAENYRAIVSSTAAEAAAVVKADGYGLGVSGIARALHAAGCRTFFTAFSHEAVALRRILDDVEIFVLMPRIGNDGNDLLANRLTPCLFDLDGVDRWIGTAAGAGSRARTALHVESGIHRLGFAREAFDTLLGDEARRSRLDVTLLMSHLACADDPAAPANRRQLDRFRALRTSLPHVRASLANSAGTFLGPDYHFDLVRPGIALFGHDPHYRHHAPRVRPVATFEAQVGQVVTVGTGESVGYGGLATCDVERRIAVVMAGYADGIPRALYRPGSRLEVTVGGQPVPLFGTVSMDMITIDLSGMPPDAVQAGTWVEIFGPSAPIERLAECAETIPYEILTRVGPPGRESPRLIAGSITRRSRTSPRGRAVNRRGTRALSRYGRSLRRG